MEICNFWHSLTNPIHKLLVEWSIKIDKSVNIFFSTAAVNYVKRSKQSKNNDD